MSNSIIIVRTTSGQEYKSSKIDSKLVSEQMNSLPDSETFWFVDESGDVVNFRTEAVETYTVRKLKDPFWKRWTANKENK